VSPFLSWGCSARRAAAVAVVAVVAAAVAAAATVATRAGVAGLGTDTPRVTLCKPLCRSGVGRARTSRRACVCAVKRHVAADGGREPTLWAL